MAIIYGSHVCLCAVQAKSAENFLRPRTYWYVKLGPGHMSGCCLDCLLLLRLERSQVYRQGENIIFISVQMASVENPDTPDELFNSSKWLSF